MKRLALSISIFLCSFFLVQAQSEEGLKAAPTPQYSNLEGIWVVENNDMLPTHLDEQYRKFLQDSLFFGSNATHAFGNTNATKASNTYYYNEKAKTLAIYDAAMQGNEYIVKAIEGDRLVFSVPNVQLNNYIDLVYVRVQDITK